MGLLPNHLHCTRTQSHHWMVGPPQNTPPSFHSGAAVETVPAQPMATSLENVSATQQVPILHHSAPQTKTLQHLCHHRGGPQTLQIHCLLPSLLPPVHSQNLD